MTKDVMRRSIKGRQKIVAVPGNGLVRTGTSVVSRGACRCHLVIFRKVLIWREELSWMDVAIMHNMQLNLVASAL